MTKSLRKAIMTHSKLRNKYNKNRTPKNWTIFKKQRNKCVKILRNVKKEYLSNLNVKDVTDSRKFWSTVKPFFSDTSKTVNNIILSDNDKMLKDEKKVPKTLNDYFTNLTKKLKLKPITFNDTVNSFENHNSICKIKGYYKDEPSFEFKQFTINELLEIIKELPSNKASVLNEIPIKIIKNSSQVYSSKLTPILNQCVSTASFPDLLKYADVTPVFKKGNVTEKENYRPISTLSNFFKIFQKLIYNQIFEFMNPKLSKYITGFQKNYNT